MPIILIASAPIIIILMYVYYRDKYEKEPLALLLKGLLMGGIIVIPILFAERLVSGMGAQWMVKPMNSAFYTAFFVAALCEEAFKFVAVYVLIWRNANFNEKFDGIVYAVFVSLGFAWVENVMYVMNAADSMHVGFLRAFTAVPAHAMFGILMGYNLGLAKFALEKRRKYLIYAFAIPFIFHGAYDFILMSEHPILLLLFIPFLMLLFVRAKKRMRELSDQSVFKEISVE